MVKVGADIVGALRMGIRNAMTEREQRGKGADPVRRGLNILVAAGLLVALIGCTPSGGTSKNNFLSSFGMPDPVL